MHNYKEIKSQIEEKLQGTTYSKLDLNNFISYLHSLDTKKNNKGQLVAYYISKYQDYELVNLYVNTFNDGMVIDGVHTTIQSTGVTYDYVAYKQKLLSVYPETIIDCQLVYKGDDFSSSKHDGKVSYSHTFNNPFVKKDCDIVGGYCIIKNSVGEFITQMSKADFDKARKVAKTGYIWSSWYPEMCFKTVIKKATKFFFDDEFSNMNKEDNKSIDLSKTPSIKKISDIADKYSKENLSDEELLNL